MHSYFYPVGIHVNRVYYLYTAINLCHTGRHTDDRKRAKLCRIRLHALWRSKVKNKIDY